VRGLPSPAVRPCRHHLSGHTHASADVVQGDVVCLRPEKRGERFEFGKDQGHILNIKYCYI